MLDPDQHLVLHSREHLPPGWADKYDAALDWSWAFVLDELSPDRTCFIFRSRLRLKRLWVEAVYLGVIVPADFIMARQMMRGLKGRVEAMSAEDLAPVRWRAYDLFCRQACAEARPDLATCSAVPLGSAASPAALASRLMPSETGRPGS